jgi:hypothetical protein
VKKPMKTNTKAWLVAVMVLVVLLGVVGCISVSGTEELSQTEVQNRDNWTYTSNFLSDDGTREAGAYVVVGSSDNICTVKLEIWHEEGTDVDEISLTFDPMLTDALAFLAPGGYPWPLAQFERTTDGEGVIYSIPHAGFQGTGTMVFEFLIRKYIVSMVASPENQIRLHIDFTMHNGGTFSKTTKHGEGDIYFKIP